MPKKNRSRLRGARAEGGKSESNKRNVYIVLGLALLTFFAYGKAGHCQFINLDDDAYVQFQPMVNQGLRFAGVVWAFTAPHSNNWHPLTSISHMLDCQLFGVRPGPMHVENVCWHALNAILVFLVWSRLTGARWRSALVAALFALHPLHVESVAWVSERKDVLSGCFFLLAIYAYTLHAKQAGVPAGGWRHTRAYWFAVGSFTLALVCKPIVVTLPLLLLLLDFWPLRRFGASHPQSRAARTLIVEKLPFLALALILSAITFFVQTTTGAANYAERFSLSARLGNAAVSCARYLGKVFWPDSLSIFYHHPGYWPAWAVTGACAILLLLSLFAWWQRKTRPWVAFGWLWFVIGLLPVLGFIQVGAQAMADRYMYLPLLGVLTAVAWSLPMSARRDERTVVSSASLGSQRGAAGKSSVDHGQSGVSDWFCSAGAAISLAACLWLTWRQTGYWHDSISLYRHSILAGEDNATVRYLLGAALQSDGAPESEATAEFRRALELDPSYVNAMTQLAVLALNHQNYEECQKWIEQSLKLEPRNPALHKNMGAFYVRTGHPEQAIQQFEEALKLEPAYADAHHELAWIALQKGQLETAARELEAVVWATPWDAQARYELGDTLSRLDRKEKAREQLERAIWIMPDFAQARERLKTLF